MMRALLRKQYLEILYLLFGRGRQGKPNSGAGMIALAILLIVCLLILAVSLVIMEIGICLVLVASGLDDMYFIVISTMGLVLGLVGSVFMAYSAIFKAKDNEILLAMPIPLGKIILSRLLGCYLVAAVFQGAVLLPGYIIYYVMSGWAGGSRNMLILAGDMLLLLTAPLLTLALSCLLAWLIAMVVKRLKHKSLVGAAIGLAAFGVYYYFIFNMDNYVQEISIAQGEQIVSGIQHYALPLYFMGMAGAGHVMYYLAFTAGVLAVFAGVYWLLARTFLKLSSGGEGVKAKAYTGQGYKVTGVKGTLLKREFRHLLSSTTVMLNGVLGSAMAVFLTVFLCLKSDAMLRDLPDLSQSAANFDASLLYVACCLIALLALTLNIIAAVSVSLEGRSLWRLKSLPVPTGDILWSKAMEQILVSGVPAVIAGIAAAVVLRPGIRTVVATIAAMLVLTSGHALVDLIIGLKRPKLDWRDEAMAMKMSLAVILSMVVNLVITLAAAAAWSLLRVVTGGALVPWIAVLALGLAIDALAVLWLRGKGEATFNALS